MHSFTIDPDIRRACTLASDFYLDPQYFELSRERIFARSWQFAGRLSEMDQLTPITLLDGFLDEPLLFVKGDRGVKSLSNVCTHRGKLLVDRQCAGNLIRCSYHGRRFDLDGKFISMPDFEGVEDFPSRADDLHESSTGLLEDFVFVSLEPAVEFSEIDAECSAHFENMAGLVFQGSRDYEVNAHWALYCENYLEGFHIPYVHHSLNDVVDYGSYTTETSRFSSIQIGYDADGNVAGRYLFIFPNTMFNFYPWGVSVNIVKPIAPNRSHITFLTYVSDETKLDAGAGANLDRVELEDEAVVESVQKGIRSRFYDSGRYSPTKERGTHHFHRLIAEFIG